MTLQRCYAEGMQRRHALQLIGLTASGAAVASAPSNNLHTKPIPSSGERLPVVGLGTWITFNVGRDAQARQQCTEVMRAFFAAGGRLIDSSPMYGSSQPVIGEGLRKLGLPKALFSAEKVWTSSDGAAQIEASRKFWQVPAFDLLQVHNLLAWQEQLPLLLEMKKAGKLRYVGITTSEGRRHRDFEQVMRGHQLDFIQLTYNPVDREAEQTLLPLARERGIAVLANRPFQEGALLKKLRRHPLPPWAGEIGCTAWSQVVLKHIVTHPAITCAIPGTSKVEHLRDNMKAGEGRLPDETLRARIAAEVS